MKNILDLKNIYTLEGKIQIPRLDEKKKDGKGIYNYRRWL